MSTIHELIDHLDYIARHAGMAARHANAWGRLKSLENIRDRAIQVIVVLARLACSGPSRSPIPRHRDRPFQSIVIADSTAS